MRRTYVVAEWVSPQEIVLDPNAVSVVRVETKGIAALLLTRLGNLHAHGLRVEAGDLNIQVLEPVRECHGVCCVPVDAEEVHHLVLGQIWVHNVAERVAEADDGGTASFLCHLVVGLRGGIVGDRCDGVNLVENASRGRGTVVEHEEERARDCIEQVRRETESATLVSIYDGITYRADVLEDRDQGSLDVGVCPDEVGDSTEEALSLVDGVGSKTSPDLAVHTSRVCLQEELGDDGELSAATSTSQCPPEVCVRSTVCVGDRAVRKDDLEVVDIVASQSLFS